MDTVRSKGPPLEATPRPSPPQEVASKSPSPSAIPTASNFGTAQPVDFMDDFRANHVLAAAGAPRSQAGRLPRREIANRTPLTPCV